MIQITTSWDDGFPKDLKIAQLMVKYNINGTFYVPKNNPGKAVLTEAEIIQISKSHEIGGHTYNHLCLKNCTSGIIYDEINMGFRWLQELLGVDPISFCPPNGYLNEEILSLAKQVGFKLIRTISLFSTENKMKNFSVDTTFQIYEHKFLTYAIHLAKRRNFKEFLWWLNNNSTTNIQKLIEKKIEYILKNGGCLHLWGHSWEIEKLDLWYKLELVFKSISGISEVKYIQNKDLITP